jgi:hypothetical protein
MADPAPKVVKITLQKNYDFMYENFVVATQHDVYLLLEKHGDTIDILHFDSANMKYGRPNDEARGAHPLVRYGLGFYGLFEVENSPWIKEMMLANRVHPSHSDSLFDGEKHYIACFKDVMLEVACRSYEEKQMPMSEINSLIHTQVENLTTN